MIFVARPRIYVGMNRPIRSILVAGAVLAALLISEIGLRAVAVQTPVQPAARTISSEDCTSAKLGSPIPVASIGEPVASVTLAAPRWVEATGNAPAYCSIDGAMAPTDTSSHGRPINFRVILPASWSRTEWLYGACLKVSLSLCPRCFRQDV